MSTTPRAGRHVDSWTGTIRRRASSAGAALERIAASIRRILGEDGGPGAIRPSPGDDMVIAEVFEFGVVHTARGPCEQLGIGGAAVAARLDTEPAANAPLAARLAITLQRLARRGLERACFERGLERLRLPAARDLKLGRLYRALDVRADHGDAIRAELFRRSVDFLRLDLVLDDDARVVVARGDRDGVPVRSRLFPGITADEERAAA